MKNINNNNLTSEISSKNYPRFFIIFCAITFTGGALVYLGNNKAIFGVISLLLIVLAFKRPNWFIYISITWILSRLIFTFYPEQYYAGGGGVAYYGRGELLLNFLRFASPDNYLIKHLPKVAFIGVVLYILHLYFRRSKSLKKVGDKQKFIVLFIFFSLASAIVNLDFPLKIVLFFYHFLFPVAIFYYILVIKLNNREKSKFFAYLMFICFEMQLFFTVIQNFPKLLEGQWSFGDYAIGTFAFPLNQVSTALLAISLLYFLAMFIVNKKKECLFKAFLAFLGILSASALTFILLLLLSLVIYFVFSYFTNIIPKTQIALSYIILSVVLAIPIFYISRNIDAYYGGKHFLRTIERTRAKRLLEISKIYSFINLGNMMINENKYIFGAGPGNFLTEVGKKYGSPLTLKYGSWNVLHGERGMAQWVENSFVGLVGEVGFLGWLFYFLFYFSLFRTFTKLARKNSSVNGKNCLFLFLSITFMFFLSYSFIIGLFEIMENIVPLLIFTALVYKGILDSKIKPKEEVIDENCLARTIPH